MGMPSDLHRFTTETGSPRNSAICFQPLRFLGWPKDGSLVLDPFAISVRCRCFSDGPMKKRSGLRWILLETQAGGGFFASLKRTERKVIRVSLKARRRDKESSATIFAKGECHSASPNCINSPTNGRQFASIVENIQEEVWRSALLAQETSAGHWRVD